MMRILILDADLRTLNALKTLGKVEYEINCPTKLDDPLSIIEDYHPDIVVMDSALEGFGSLFFIVQMRSKWEYRDLGLIVIGLRLRPREKVRYLNAGADDCLSKPFEVTELMARVRALSKRMKRYSEEQIDVSGNLLLDGLSKQVFVDGVEISLTLRAFTLLQFLVQNRGHGFSANELLEEIWKSCDYTISNVTVTIYVLRRAIEPDPTNPTRIVTAHHRYFFVS